MPNTAVRVYPIGPEMGPEAGGLLKETWRVIGDASSATITITPEIVRKIYFVAAANAHHNLPTTPGQVATSVLLTFPANLGNGIKHDIIIYGKA